MVEDVDWKAEAAFLKKENDVYAEFAEKFGDLSCCYDAHDICAVIQRGFESLKEAMMADIVDAGPVTGPIYHSNIRKALGVPADGSIGRTFSDASMPIRLAVRR